MDTLFTLADLMNELDDPTLTLAQRDRGTIFEKICLVYFKYDPLYKQRFSEVWMLSEVPDEYGIPKKDDGIDIVAKDRITGDLVGIQCKYYDSEAKISKGTIDSFLRKR